MMTGVVEVGKWFATPCDKRGTGDPTGLGLYEVGTDLIPELFGGHTREEDGTWRLSTFGTSVATTQSGFHAGTFRFDVCGWLSAVFDPDRSERNSQFAIGASCGTSKAHDGQGNMQFDNGERLKLFDFGWKAAVGGWLPITGRYQEFADDSADPQTAAKKDKFGQILGFGGMQGGPACSSLNTAPTNNGNGAQLFAFFAVMELVNGVSADAKDVDPLVGGPKRCKGVGPPATPDPWTGRKSHERKPPWQPCAGGEK